MSKKILKGKVISLKMQNTAIVDVMSIKKNKVYNKAYKVNKKYKVHYDGNDLKEGMNIEIIENRPISSGKKWIVKKNEK